MIKQKEFLEYLRTIFITMIVICVTIVMLLFIIQHQIYQENKQKHVEEETIDYGLIAVMIEKNKYLETQSPLNYKINLKLGTLYEIQKNYKDAEVEYKKSIAKAPCNEFKPQYNLALMYLLINRLEAAQEVMDNIHEEPNDALIKYKADIYERLGDMYYNSADYEMAVEQYTKSLFYWKIIKDNKEIEYVQNSLASSYVYLADADVRDMRPQDAVSSLKNVLLMFDAPILKYKLALLLMKDDPEEASRYFAEVYKEAPELIDYDTYYNFLTVMADDANARGDTAKSKWLRFRQGKIKEYFKTNILTVDDLALEDVKGKIKQNKWFKKNNISFEAKIKNISDKEIDSLFVELVFKDNNEVIENYFAQVVDNKSSLAPGESSPMITIRLSQPMAITDFHPKSVAVEVYASKTKESMKLHLTTVGIKERVKKKRTNEFLKKFALFFEKITSKMPAFLF